VESKTNTTHKRGEIGTQAMRVVATLRMRQSGDDSVAAAAAAAAARAAARVKTRGRERGASGGAALGDDDDKEGW
jgi:hypothetical protein